MPQYFQSSPWQDAARYGAGLGDTLGQAFIQLPQQRAMIAMHAQQQQQAMQQRAFENQQQLLQQQQLGQYRDQTTRETARHNRFLEDQSSYRTIPAPGGGYVSNSLLGQQEPMTPVQVPQAMAQGAMGDMGPVLGQIIGLLGQQSQQPPMPGRTFVPTPQKALVPAEHERVMSPGSVLMQNGAPVYTNTNYKAESPMRIPASELATLSTMTNAPQVQGIVDRFKALSQQFQQGQPQQQFPQVTNTPNRRFRFDPATQTLIPQ